MSFATVQPSFPRRLRSILCVRTRVLKRNLPKDLHLAKEEEDLRSEKYTSLLFGLFRDSTKLAIILLLCLSWRETDRSVWHGKVDNPFYLSLTSPVL